MSVDPGTGSVTLRAVFPNPEQQLLPGMFVQAQLQTGSKSAAILAPQQGVTRNPRARRWPWWSTPRTRWSRALLKAERTAGSFWLVSEGLAPGDRLITEGLQFIRAGRRGAGQAGRQRAGAVRRARPGSRLDDQLRERTHVQIFHRPPHFRLGDRPW